MTETENDTVNSQPANAGEAMDQQQRIVKLEEALAEYVERYGLTDKARDAFRYPKR